MSVMTSEQVRDYIVSGLECEHIEVFGDDGAHFEAIIVSSEFEGLNRIRRHQRVYKALGNRMDTGEIHALSMRTLTPEDRKSTRLNSSHVAISYAVFCL